MALLLEAQEKLDVVQPEGLRLPLEILMAAAAAELRGHWNVLGKPFNGIRMAAQAVVDEWKRVDRDGTNTGAEGG